MESPKHFQPISERDAKQILRVCEYVIHQAIDDRYKTPTNPTLPGYVIQGINELAAVNGNVLSYERICDFILYQLFRYKDMIPGKLRGWKIDWAFSHSAIDKYRQQFLTKEGKKGITYFIQQWCQEYEVDTRQMLAIIRPVPEHPMKQFINMPSEEYIKLRWHNTDNGFVLCQQGTTGWSPTSAACSKCVYQAKCQVVTDKKYPELVRLRRENFRNNGK